MEKLETISIKIFELGELVFLMFIQNFSKKTREFLNFFDEPQTLSNGRYCVINFIRLPIAKNL